MFSIGALTAMVLLIAGTGVWARPGGAPLAACDRIYPEGHNGYPRQPSNGSFSLSTQVFAGGAYVPNQSYSITLKGTDVFKGLLVQARLAADGTTPVGSFTPGGVVKLSACTISNSAVTHMDGLDKTNATFVWTAPPSNNTGPVVFYYAVVVNYDPAAQENTFYATLMTQPIKNAFNTGAAANTSLSALLGLMVAAVSVQAFSTY